MQLVAAAALGLLALLVSEYGKIVGVRRLRPDDLVVQHVALGADFMGRYSCSLRIAQQAGMDEWEMAEVGEIFHLAGRVAAPRKRSRENRLPCWRFQFGNFG